MAFSMSASSAAVPSPSPSSFWIWRICSRSTYSRWRSSIVALVRDVDLARELQHLDAVREHPEHAVDARLDREGLEHRLLLRRLARP